MRLIGNALNGEYFDNLVYQADRETLEGIDLAVAYVRDLGPLVDVARKRRVPVRLYALSDEGGFPSLSVLRLFLNNSPPSWQLYLTRSHYHPKITWLRGVGCYIGSANLTDSGRMSNLECGVWFDHSDLQRDNFDTQLESILAVIHGRSTAAIKEDIARFERLESARQSLAKARKELSDKADRELAHIRGADAPAPWMKEDSGGAIRARFIQDWNGCLTLLRKLGRATAGLPRPAWVDSDVEPAVAFDQATEYYYTRVVRKSGTKRDEVVRELHGKNKADPDAAVGRVFTEWAAFDGEEGTWEWAAWCNEHPKKLRALLAENNLASLAATALGEVIWLTHAAREHARQVDNATLGLAPGTTLDIRARCDEFARFLLRQRSKDGKTLHEVLQFVLWGERQDRDAAARIWDATMKAAWKLPHLGPSILGEMIGYARPDEFPPRNQRVVRTLYALGFSPPS